MSRFLPDAAGSLGARVLVVTGPALVAARLLAASAICDWPQEGTPDRALPVIALPTPFKEKKGARR